MSHSCSANGESPVVGSYLDALGSLRSVPRVEGELLLTVERPCRTSSQKPGDDLLANFRQQFPEVATASTTASAAGPARTATTGHADIPVSGQERCVSLSCRNTSYARHLSAISGDG